MRDAWREKLERFKIVAPDPDLLQGASVWLGRATDGPAGNMADDIAEFLTEAGAEIATSTSGPRGTICGPDVDSVDNADAVLMIGATPGVTAEAIDFCRDGPWKRTISPRMFVVLPDEHRNGYMYSRLNELGANKELYSAQQADDGTLAITGLYRVASIYRNEKLEEKEAKTPNPTIGVVTALSLEFEAVKRAMPGGRRLRIRTDGVGLRTYFHLSIPADDGGEHHVVVLNGGMSNNKASTAAKQLMNDHPTVRDVIMVGIAGGVPDLSNAKEDVHLGDVVISGAKGVVKYDMKKVTSDGDVPNHEPRPPSAEWLQIAEELAYDEDVLAATWDDLDRAIAEARIARPAVDELLDEPDPKDRKPAERPVDPSRPLGRPRVMFGTIGCADSVVKSAKARDEVADKFDIMAFEMEGSGIAEVTWQATKGYLVVRGICDYCNDAKNKEWQPYAAAAAATFARHLIASMPVVAVV